MTAQLTEWGWLFVWIVMTVILTLFFKQKKGT